MKNRQTFNKYKKKNILRNFYFLRGDIKFEIFESLNNLNPNKFNKIKKIWNFFVLYKTIQQTKNLMFENKGIKINIFNQKKTEGENGNILAFPEIIENSKVQLKKIPINSRPKSLYINFQYDINKKMRAILIDWLIDVHCKFKLVPATLFLTINSIDRFLSLHVVMRQKLQLLGISSMLLASKYEEIYAPETKDFVYISDNAYSKDDIFKMEILICTTLDYIFQFPTPLFFISDWSKIFNASQEEIIFSMYTLELHLIDYDSIVFENDVISISSLLNSIYLLNNFNKRLDTIKFFRKLNGKQLNLQNLSNCLAITNSLLILNQNVRKKLNSLRRKYNHKKYKEISEITFLTYFEYTRILI